MNLYLISRVIAHVVQLEAAFMLVPLVLSFVFGENPLPFVFSIVIMLAAQTPLMFTKKDIRSLQIRDGLVIACLSWIAMSVFGCLPYLFSGYFSSVIDCIFESVSGFTTTGATIIVTIESMPSSILFWRSFSQWLGGMGVLVFVLALLPSMGASAVHILRAETTGPSPGKLVPRLKETAKIMYAVYIFLTVLCAVMLWLTGMPIFDSFVHSMSVAGTAGFSLKTLSVSAYNDPLGEIVITVFMLIFGINFSLFHLLLLKKFKSFFANEELRVFFGIVAVSIIIITLNILRLNDYDVLLSLRQSAFQVSSIISTSGFFTVDYDLWPTFSKIVLTFLMFVGSCSGSTCGAFKVVRFWVLVKSIAADFSKKLHPNIVSPVKLGGKIVDKEIIAGTSVFFSLYMLLLLVGTLVISLENKDLVSSFSSVLAALSNIGPGFGIVGPIGNYSSFNTLSKSVLCFLMFAGRLELLPMMIIFLPAVWKKSF